MLSGAGTGSLVAMIRYDQCDRRTFLVLGKIGYYPPTLVLVSIGGHVLACVYMHVYIGCHVLVFVDMHVYIGGHVLTYVYMHIYIGGHVLACVDMHVYIRGHVLACAEEKLVPMTTLMVLRQPSGQVVSEHKRFRLVFEVVCSTCERVTYQWYFMGSKVTGEEHSTLTRSAEYMC